MKKRRIKSLHKLKKYRVSNKNCNFYGGSGGIYFFGLIGSLIYYIQHADTFGAGVLGVLKAIVWPAIIIYKLTGFLG